jgi:hypothetical protein
MYCKGSELGIFFYDITDKNSLKSLEEYSKLFDEFSGRENFKILVGTKWGLELCLIFKIWFKMMH